MCQNVPKTIQDTGQVTGQDNMQVIWDITNRKSNSIHQNKHAIVCTKSDATMIANMHHTFLTFFD